MSEMTLPGSAKSSWGWLLALGIAYLIFGFVVMGHPVIATWVIDFTLGFILIIGGITSVVAAFFAGDWKRFLFIFISGVLYIIVGGLIIKNPFAGVLTLTLLLAAFLLVEGVFKVIHAFQMKPEANWIWLLVSGAASVILGLMIWTGFPQSGVFVIGLLVGIYLLIDGISMVMISLALKNS